MDITPIKKNLTLKEQAYESIKQAIYSNTLVPGTPLTEEQLSSTLAISRTPIRSALQQLVYEKLATKDATGHIFVSTVTEKDVHNATVLRSVLEPMAVETASFPLSENKISSLSDILEQQKELFRQEPANNYDYAELDFKFHCLLGQLSENELLADIIKDLNHIMIRIHILSGTLTSHKQQALDEHTAIIEFLKKGQRQFSKLAIEEHIKNVELRIFSENDDSISAKSEEYCGN